MLFGNLGWCVLPYFAKNFWKSRQFMKIFLEINCRVYMYTVIGNLDFWDVFCLSDRRVLAMV
jgi:hypothetical protein